MGCDILTKKQKKNATKKRSESTEKRWIDNLSGFFVVLDTFSVSVLDSFFFEIADDGC